MIVGAEDIARVFSIFHDGSIALISATPDLGLKVEIQYLAERIAPQFSGFMVVLHNPQSVAFSPWYRDTDQTNPDLSEYKAIFDLELGVLQAEAKAGLIEVVCDAYPTDSSFSGGLLRFRAESATVSDESGRDYTVEELAELASGYWSDWASKKPS